MRPLYEIAYEIATKWKEPYFGAAPYIAAMRELESPDDHYGQDTAKSIVIYFLSNAAYWRGPVARRIKAELKSMFNIK